MSNPKLEYIRENSLEVGTLGTGEEAIAKEKEGTA
jgi:hypothetical protein